MTGYQVLGRRKGRGELRRFNLPVVAFGPKATMMSTGEGNDMIYTDLGLYLRGSSAHSAYRRDQLTNIWIPFTPATVTVSNTRFWATDTDGRVWRSGYWNSCEKTDFEEMVFETPIQRMFIDTFRSYHFTALAENGDIYVMGDNYDGQLGLGDYENRESFVKVPGIPKVKWVMNGYIQSAFITEDGCVYVSGSNSYGTQGIIGLGLTEKINTFQEIVLWKNVGMAMKQFAVHGVMEWGGLYLISTAGDLFTCGYGAMYPQLVPDISGLVQVACAYDFVLVLKQDGSVWGAPILEDRPITGTDFYPLGITDIVEICGDGSSYVAMMRNSSGQVTFYSSWSNSLTPAEYLPIGEDCCTVTPY